MAQSGTLGGTADLTGLGSIAVSGSPIVAQGLALGSTTDGAGLGSGTGSGIPIVSADSSLNSHNSLVHSDGQIIVVGVKDLAGSKDQIHSLVALSTRSDGTLEAHDQSIGRNITELVGSTNKDQGGLSKAGLAEVQAALQGGVDSRAASHEGQTSGQIHFKQEAAQVADSRGVHFEGDGIAHSGGSLVSLHGVFHAGSCGGRRDSSADGDGGAGGVNVEVVIFGIEHLAGSKDEIDGQSTGSTFINSALEAHDLSLSSKCAGLVGGTDKNQGGFSKAGFTEVQAALQGGIHAGAAAYEGQTLGNLQLKQEAAHILHRADGDGVGDGITHGRLGLVCFHRKVDGRHCGYRYHSGHQAHEQGKTQDDRCNSLVHDQAPFL